MSRALLPVGTLILAAGCQGQGSRHPVAPTHLDHLIQAYPELRSGRFIVIADFQDPRQMELIHLIGVSDHARCVHDLKKGRAETGLGCLTFDSGSPDDTIVMNNKAASNWYLKRDWRPYDLLLMSIQSPQRDLLVEITISGGDKDNRLAAQASLPLDRGWNVVRLDLAEIGERVPLDDVREIRLAVSGASKPVQLRFDDLLLTASREDVFGDSQERDSGLFVQRIGRRWKIGAAGSGADFELTFSNGQIIEWYNVAADPYRLRNLVRGTTLGPAPVAVTPADPGESGLASLGDAVVVRSQIVEMNPVRVVVTSEWRFVGDLESAHAGLDRQPFKRWVYVIYSTGQMYVSVEMTAETDTWSASQLGLSVNVAATEEDQLKTLVVSPVDNNQQQLTPSYATARSDPRDSLMLFVPSHNGRAIHITQRTQDLELDSAQADQATFVAVGGRPEGNVARWTSHIMLGDSATHSPEEVRARALDYVRPIPPRVELGSLVAIDGGDPANRGYDPQSGCYVLAAEQGRLRFYIESSGQTRFSPAFKVLNPDRLDVSIYVDHMICDRVGRDPAGHLILQIPGKILKPTLVEVLFRRPEHLSGP